MGDLAHVRWIGGGSGAGKSTVADILGERLRIPVVHTDLSIGDHAAAMAGAERVDAFARMSMDERWVEREPEEMLRTFPFFAGDGFDLLVDELRRRPRGPVLVEGFRLLPSLLAPLLGDARHAVWLLPTPAMRAAAMAGRAGQGRAFWERTSDPARALANLLERDRRFTERLRSECEDAGLPILDVDGTLGVQEVAARAEALLSR